MKIEIDKDFDGFDYDNTSFVLNISPDVHFDERGSFSETWKLVDDAKVYGISECPVENTEHRTDDNSAEPDMRLGNWIEKTNWFKQINTSKSSSIVLRGCHAQQGIHCQAKLVSSISGKIYDIITDARPNSKTFMKSKVYFLNPTRQNKVFVPRGFLHAFVTSHEDSEYIFQYMCDNTYFKDSEIKVNPMKLAVPAFYKYCETYGVDNFLKKAIDRSEASILKADLEGKDPNVFFEECARLWESNGAAWYA